MEQDATRIASILTRAPVWARLALTSADRRLVERGADQLAAFIIRKLDEVEIDPRQLPLRLEESR